MKVPWDFIAGTNEPAPGMVPALPDAAASELGAHMARFFDAEFAKTGRDSRCQTCAFRSGTLANTSLNVANAVKCAVEGEPFYCHETERPCGGWIAFARPEKANA